MKDWQPFDTNNMGTTILTNVVVEAPPSIGVFVIDDNPQQLSALYRVIDGLPHFRLLGRQKNSEDVIKEISGLRPDLIVISSHDCIRTAIDLTRKVKARLPKANLLILSSLADMHTAKQFFRAGAIGYCLESSNAVRFALALQTIAAGAAWIDPSLSTIVLKQAAISGICTAIDTSQRSEEALLSQRELHVLKLIAEGLTNPEIASQLWLSPETVKSHVKNIMRKLAAKDRTQAVVMALQNGLKF